MKLTIVISLLEVRIVKAVVHNVNLISISLLLVVVLKINLKAVRVYLATSLLIEVARLEIKLVVDSEVIRLNKVIVEHPIMIAAKASSGLLANASYFLAVSIGIKLLNIVSKLTWFLHASFIDLFCLQKVSILVCVLLLLYLVQILQFLIWLLALALSLVRTTQLV